VRNYQITKLLGASLIAASLTIVPLNLPAKAQSTTDTTTRQQNSNVEATGPITANTNRDHNNWGWLGLLGLAGLAGLARKKRPVTTQYVSNDPDVRVRSGNDFR
jgi:MYXO-CTERM domain-containing protein